MEITIKILVSRDAVLTNFPGLRTFAYERLVEREMTAALEERYEHRDEVTQFDLDVRVHNGDTRVVLEGIDDLEVYESECEAIKALYLATMGTDEMIRSAADLCEIPDPEEAGRRAAQSVHQDVLNGISPEADDEDEAADFDEYVSEEIPDGLLGAARREWMAAYCRAADQEARALYAARRA